MTALPPNAAPASAAPPATAASGDGSAQGLLPAPPVICGPIAASSLGGIPFIAINSPLHLYSGKRVTEWVLEALDRVDVTIKVPE